MTSSASIGSNFPAVNRIHATSAARTKEIIDPTYPLLEAHRSKIEAIERETFEYAAEPSRLLDAYYPPLITVATPILFFIYGGGFQHGSRSAPPAHLVYANLGSFFAARGIITVVPDYRLVPDAKDPDGAVDVAAAFQWILSSASSSSGASFRARCGDAAQRAWWAIGHSAGGVHLATVLLSPDLFTEEIARVVKGTVMMSTPFEMGSGQTSPSAEAYYGSAALTRSRQPIELLHKAAKECLVALPKEMWCMVASSEPKRIKRAHASFAKAYRERGGSVKEWIMEGHDHLSPVLALGAEVGEEWAEEVTRWIIRTSAASSATVAGTTVE